MSQKTKPAHKTRYIKVCMYLNVADYKSRDIKTLKKDSSEREREKEALHILDIVYYFP